MGWPGVRRGPSRRPGRRTEGPGAKAGLEPASSARHLPQRSRFVHGKASTLDWSKRHQAGDAHGCLNHWATGAKKPVWVVTGSGRDLPTSRCSGQDSNLHHTAASYFSSFELSHQSGLHHHPTRAPHPPTRSYPHPWLGSVNHIHHHSTPRILLDGGAGRRESQIRRGTPQRRTAQRSCRRNGQICPRPTSTHTPRVRATTSSPSV